MSRAGSPLLRVVVEGDGRFEISADLDADYPGFQGHFPGDPVLPGMCHVDVAVRASGLALRRDVRVEAVDEARFLVKVRPQDQIRVHLTLEPAADGSTKVHAMHMVGSTRAAELVLRVR